MLGLPIEDPVPLRLADVGEHPRSYGFPPGHPPMGNFLGVPIVIRGQAWGNLYLTEKPGADFDEADEQTALVLAEWTAIAVDNARLYADMGKQRDSLERAVRGLEATTEVTRAVGGETDLSLILETIAKRGRALVEARSLLILLEDAGELRVTAAAGEFEDHSDLRLTVAGSAPGQVFKSLQPSRLRDLDSALLSESDSLGMGGESLLVPLVFRGKSVGVLVALDPLAGGSEFGLESEQVLGSFAASAATAVATAQSAAEVSVRNSIEAAERERGRWARELHDESLQSLAGLRVVLSAARRSGNPDDVDRLLSQAVEQVDSTIAEMRRLIADLRPATLDELGLAAALEALVERLRWGDVLDVKLRVELATDATGNPIRFLGQIEDSVYRLVQEALTNVVKHAGIDRARVEVIEVDDEIRVSIGDRGQGFVTGASSDGFGLLGMHERVVLAGGTLAVTSEPETGTTITAKLPADHRADAR
ncbi:MAG: GAF domain-containing sensor histidine kinase [Solirubrobacterales bacterium]|nr:GAF domain-containing sensor histidine kinase [Solirubrobacterales bacterium]